MSKRSLKEQIKEAVEDRRIQYNTCYTIPQLQKILGTEMYLSATLTDLGWKHSTRKSGGIYRWALVDKDLKGFVACMQILNENAITHKPAQDYKPAHIVQDEMNLKRFNEIIVAQNEAILDLNARLKVLEDAALLHTRLRSSA